MKLPYGYVLIEGEIAVHEEKADIVRSIFDAYLAGASLNDPTQFEQVDET